MKDPKSTLTAGCPGQFSQYHNNGRLKNFYDIFLKEYEWTAIFRLGRLLSGEARGPGVFFIIPCVDNYEKIDLRVRNFNVPPQEVTKLLAISITRCLFL